MFSVAPAGSCERRDSPGHHQELIYLRVLQLVIWIPHLRLQFLLYSIVRVPFNGTVTSEYVRLCLATIMGYN